MSVKLFDEVYKGYFLRVMQNPGEVARVRIRPTGQNSVAKAWWVTGSIDAEVAKAKEWIDKEGTPQIVIPRGHKASTPDVKPEVKEEQKQLPEANWGLPLDVYQAAQVMKLGQPMLDVIDDYHLRQHYKLMAKVLHADHGGNDKQMAELNDAYAVLKRWVK